MSEAAIQFLIIRYYQLIIVQMRVFETVSTEICEEFFSILHQTQHKIDFFEKNQQHNLCFVALCCHNLMASFINVIWAQYYLLDICIIHHYPENEGAKSWNLSKRFCSHQGINIMYLYSLSLIHIWRCRRRG